jgi:ABC-2 type transport system permease protein
MDILKSCTDWARAEVLSAKIVWLFSAIEIFAAVGFWYFGKTLMAKAFIWPLAVSGFFLVAVAAGLYFANYPRIEEFKKRYTIDAKVFTQEEIARTAKSQGDLAMVFKILPAIIVLAAIVIFLIHTPVWRAIGITVIITTAFLMIVDSNTDARNTDYHLQLTRLQP